MIGSSDWGVRERILQSAMAEFGHSGLHGARTRAICATAGVNVSTLHYHFGSKEALFQDAVTFAARQMAGVLQTVQAGPENDLSCLVQEMAGFFAAHPDVPRVLLQAILERWDGSAMMLDTLADIVREVATPLDDATRPHLRPEAVVLAAGSLLVTMGLVDPIRQRIGDVTAWDMQAAVVGMFQAMFEDATEPAAADVSPREETVEDV